MKFLTGIIERIVKFFGDRQFLKLIHITENIVSKVLSLALIVVILFCLFDLVVILIKEIFFVESEGMIFNIFPQIFDIFGLFLNILIALELLENITVYLKKHVVQVELVLITALMAVARKIIIFDPTYSQKVDLIPLGIVTLCLAASYTLVRYSNSNKK